MMHPAEQVGAAALRALLQIAVGKQDEDKGHPQQGEEEINERMSGPSCHGIPDEIVGFSLIMIIVGDA
jgi:hypothetical protein